MIRMDTVGDGVALWVWVVPGASRTGIVGAHGDSLKVRVAAPAERGRANAAVVDLLESVLGRPVRLEATTGRRKRVVVEGMRLDEVERLLGVQGLA